MREVKNDGQEELAFLELVLQLHREYRRNLETIHVTPLQAVASVSALSCRKQRDGRRSCAPLDAAGSE
jgi:hypothetical protein